MSNKELAKQVQDILKQQGHQISLGHAYEYLSRLSGYKSWNEASAKNADLSEPFKKK